MPKPKTTPKPTAKPARHRNKNRPTTKVTAASSTTASALPGYLKYTRQVGELIWVHKPVFLRLIGLAWLLLLLGSATAEYAQYVSLSDAAHEAVNIVDGSGLRSALLTWILASSVTTGSLVSGLTEGQNIFRAAVYFGIWLVTVWLLRHLLAKTAVTVRDGLYNAGAPIVSTMVIAVVGIVQLLPLALLVALFAALLNTGALNQPIVIVLMGLVSLGSAIVTLYWLTNTFFAFIVATIPGTYPLAALRSARKVIAGHRVAVLLRLLWLIVVVVVVGLVILLPLLYLDAAFHVPVAFLVVALSQLLAVTAMTYASAYIYLLYRKVIDGRSE